MMNEKRLYSLAHEALLLKWSREHDFLSQHPGNKISQYHENKLWNELMMLEDEIRTKNIF